MDLRTLRGRVTVILNLTLLILLALFLAIDFQRDLKDRLRLQRTALDEQARMIEPNAEIHLAIGMESLNGFVEATLKIMDCDHHSDHWIAVSTRQGWSGSGLPDGRAADILSRLDQVTKGERSLQQAFTNQFLVGHHEGEKVHVFVAETYREIRLSSGVALRRHIWGAGILMLVGIVIFNVLMSTALVGPLERLSSAADAIGKREFHEKLPHVGIREIDGLASAFNAMGEKLTEAELSRDSQLQMARQIQEHLLPRDVEIPGYVTEYLFKPLDSIGGDYFDVLTLKDGSYVIAMTDASGHGVPAALMSAVVKILLLDSVERLTDPAAIIKSIDRRLTNLRIPDAFVTMLLVRIIPDSKRVEYANAGHVSGWVIDDTPECHPMASTGPIVGADLGLDWETAQIPFPGGSRMVLVTDGIVEAAGPLGDSYGEKRLQEALIKTRRTSAIEAPQAIFEQIDGYMHGNMYLDDVTLLVIDSETDGADGGVASQ